VATVPVYASMPAGLSEDALPKEESVLLIDVETLGIKPTARTFGLRVQGDSMIGLSIVDGDLAIIEHGVKPRPGDIVAALIDGQLTLKTLVWRRGKPYLRAAPRRRPNLIPQADLQIQGVLVALVRRRKFFPDDASRITTRPHDHSLA
jgi:SOS-response transcriptional repressor LexA